MDELKMLSIYLSKGYVRPILNYLEECNAESFEDTVILLKPPIMYCIAQFNNGYNITNIENINKTIKTIKNIQLKSYVM